MLNSYVISQSLSQLSLDLNTVCGNKSKADKYFTIHEDCQALEIESGRVYNKLPILKRFVETVEVNECINYMFFFEHLECEILSDYEFRALAEFTLYLIIGYQNCEADKTHFSKSEFRIQGVYFLNLLLHIFNDRYDFVLVDTYFLEYHRVYHFYKWLHDVEGKRLWAQLISVYGYVKRDFAFWLNCLLERYVITLKGDCGFQKALEDVKTYFFELSIFLDSTNKK